ncbi:MAG TPA: TetR/AcrR family transcriptional regulator [Ktedonobacteraceae bacterium]|jgi:AcrR family transcriptional regulator
MQSTHRSLKEKQRQERESLILQVAEEVLLEKGYTETSIDEIAARVGIAKGTVYLHFPSKEDLVVTIFALNMQTLLEGVDGIIANQPSYHAKLEALLYFMYTGLFSKRAQLLSSIHTCAELMNLFTQKGSRIRELWHKLATVVASLLDEGQLAGEFTTTIPTPILVGSFFSLLSPLHYQRLRDEEHFSTEELVRSVAHIYFGGIMSE